MRVLELGCGIGEVSLIAARLVGPHGYVHCIDIDGDALEIARGRCRSAGHDHVAFEKVDVATHAPVQLYDAVMGRHILIHTPDAAAVLQKAVDRVHVGGLIAFQEYDLSFYPKGYPELPLMFWVEGILIEFFHRGVPRPNIGTQLFWLMQDAGLPPPECRLECVMDGGPYSPVYEWLAETVRSLLPVWKPLESPMPEPLTATPWLSVCARSDRKTGRCDCSGDDRSIRSQTALDIEDQDF